MNETVYRVISHDGPAIYLHYEGTDPDDAFAAWLGVLFSGERFENARIRAYSPEEIGA